jgi:hypothetical protein
MWEAMDLIRDMVGPEKLVLGCGVPLAAAFRKVDYCRIGSDVAPWWEGNICITQKFWILIYFCRF